MSNDSKLKVRTKYLIHTYNISKNHDNDKPQPTESSSTPQEGDLLQIVDEENYTFNETVFDQNWAKALKKCKNKGNKFKNNIKSIKSI
jgi:hypothetical protein